MTKSRRFVHCHVHADTSMLDGAARIDDLLAECVRMGMPALAVTDHGNMFSAHELWSKARKCGINPIIGMEAYVSPGSRHVRKKVPLVEGSDPLMYTHMTLLAETTAGMHNLFRLASLASMEGQYYKPRCLLPGQEIVTRNGMKRIEDIQAGDEVLTHRGRFRPVVRTMQNVHGGDIYGLRLSSRYSRVTWMTGEHPVLIRHQDGTRSWVSARDIATGRPLGRSSPSRWNSWVCLPRVRSDAQVVTSIDTADYVNWVPDLGKPDRFVKITERKIGPTRCFARLSRTIDLDFDFGFLLGLYISEGCIDPHGGVSFSFHQDEIGLVETCCKLVWKYTGKSPRMVNHSNRPGYKGVTAKVYSSVLAQLLAALCGSGGCHKYRMPDFTFDAPESFMDGIFRGVMAGDGSKTRPEVKCLFITSEQLLWQMRTLAARLNADFTGIYMIDRKPVNQRRLYNACFSPDQPLKYRYTISDEQYVYKPIKSVEVREYRGVVYNIEVAEDSSYVTDFAVHNCDRELLSQHRKGVIATTGCPSSEINRLLQWGRYEEACETAGVYRDIFGLDNYFLELMDHGIEIERSTREDTVRLAQRLRLPYLATNDAHYTRQSDARSHDVILCVQTGARISDVDRFRFEGGPEYYLKSPEQMRALFDDEFPEACNNTLAIAERVNVRFIEGRRDLMPRFDVPANEEVAGW